MEEENYIKKCDWCDKKVKELGGHTGRKCIDLPKLIKEFKKNVGYQISSNSLYYQLYAARRRVYGVGKARSKESIFRKSNFLLVIGEKVQGFETPSEIKEFISTNLVMLRDVIIFEKKKVEVNYTIDIK